MGRSLELTRPMLKVTTWITDEVRERYERSGAWTDETWWDRLTEATRQDPGATSVVDETGRLSRGEVLAAGERIAAFLWDRGIRTGDVVSVILPNWRELVVVHAAVGRLGCVFNAMLPVLGAAEMRHVFSTAGTRWVFAAAEHRGRTPHATAVEAADGLAHVEGLSAVRGSGAQGEAPTLEEILAEPWEESVELPEDPIDPRGPDTLLFTSGTEAAPKGVVHSHQTAFFDLRTYIGGILGLGADDSVFMPSPVCHASGLQWGLRTAIFAAAPLILQDRWDAKRALELIDEHGCTYTLGATPFITDMVAARRAGHGSGASLRYVVSGGAPIPRGLVGEVREVLGAQLLSVFGASENYVTTANLPGDTDEHLRTDGRAIPGVEVRIADERGRPLPPGEEGEIITKGPHVFVGYVGDPELTRRAFHGEWYRFGDLGRLDKDGYLEVTGRIKDIVIRGGQNISVREVEEKLQDHPAITAVAIVGVPDERLGERCCAVVVPAPGREPTLEDLVEHLTAKGIAKYKLPERIALVDELPMTATGKVRKAELRRWLAEGGGS